MRHELAKVRQENIRASSHWDLENGGINVWGYEGRRRTMENCKRTIGLYRCSVHQLSGTGSMRISYSEWRSHDRVKPRYLRGPSRGKVSELTDALDIGDLRV
jgi:hypothetical protein